MISKEDARFGRKTESGFFYWRNMEIIKTSWPNVYSCNFIEQGLVAYEKEGGSGDKEILYVSKETIDRMLPSIIGRSVVIKHQKINPDNYEQKREEKKIVGNVIRAWFNPSDGWFWCDFLVDIQAGRTRIDQEQDSVSCAYKVIDSKEGGVWHDIPYDGEITDGSFTHLALVESPRYEGAKITKQLPAVLVNEKAAYLFNNKEDYMNFKDLLFQKKPDGSKEKLQGVIVINGKDVDLGEFLGTLVEKINEKGEKKTVTLDDVIVHNGKEISIKELVNMAIKNEKCTCGAEEGKEHKENCAMYEKKNETDDERTTREKREMEDAKENTRLNAKAKEMGKTVDEVKAIEAQEKLNESPQAKRIKELELENARLKKEKEGDEFYNTLETLSNSNLAPEIPVNNGVSKSRFERAAEKSKQIKSQKEFAIAK